MIYHQLKCTYTTKRKCTKPLGLTAAASAVDSGIDTNIVDSNITMVISDEKWKISWK